ncbi:TcmI family type II polyketide cyclase [Micromonospora echinofusca]|uniref:TcmI family type II polyketide cyclase n=1 Tax=Micromonospora echinofusca TaxID=47858 RepID=A0ABS3VQH0_MICEH|nr:TcmI family type II polyketide cyclase [Micromonospora echinofusca]MBO4206785.1 TcmI family type II polyketide cyclase [Micromonospora echinofusca]
MNRLLIVGKVLPGADGELAEIFAEADGTELPVITGVRHRSLYRLGDLYLHLMETDADPTMTAREQEHPAFRRVFQRLSGCTEPYLPTARSPRDAMAACIYHWDMPGVVRR